MSYFSLHTTSKSRTETAGDKKPRDIYELWHDNCRLS